jgi:hypothetical protein
MLHAYGPDIFDEAMLDPIKTIRRDIMPRFTASPYCAELETRAESINELPSAISLTVPPPISCAISEALCSGSRSPDLSLMDFLDDRHLYSIFLKYLKSIVSSENLLCVTMIRQFDALVQSVSKRDSQTHGNFADPKNFAIRESAWTIYLYFVAPGSPFEVSVSHARRREIMYGLAEPSVELFKAAELTSFDALQANFATFKLTPAFRDVQKTVLSLLDADITVRRSSFSICGF